MKSKIKKSDLEFVNNTLDEVGGFLSNFLDFADDEQSEYVSNLLDDIRKSEDIIGGTNNVNA